MLKHSDDKVKTEFALLVINFINPKYNIPQVEIKPDIEKCKDFASKCQLTKDEFMIALDMASRRLLTYKDGKKELLNPNYDGETVEYFREIDLSVLGKIETAYIQFKQKDVQYDNGKRKISKHLNDEGEKTLEEAKAERRRNWDVLIQSVKDNKPCDHAFLFYEMVLKKGGLRKFISDPIAQKIVIKKKMFLILQAERMKTKSVMFNQFEIKYLSEYFRDPKEFLHQEVKFAFDRLQAMATTLVKNDLVYNWIKKEIKKNERRAAESDKDLSEKQG